MRKLWCVLLLLSIGSAAQAQGVSYTASTGELWIWGSPFFDDIIGCSGDKENLTVEINGEEWGPYDVGDTRVVVDLGSGDDVFIYARGSTAPEDQPKFYVAGGDGDDSIITGDRDDWVYGGNGNDTMSAFGGVDQVWAGAGWDTVLTGTGPDYAYGGTGWDIIWEGYNENDYVVEDFEEFH